MKKLILSLGIICIISSLSASFCQTTTVDPKIGTINTINTRTDIPTTIDKRIITEQEPVIVTTNPVSSIGATTAVCSYKVDSKTPVIQHGICINKAPAPTVDNTKFFSKSGPGPVFSAEMNGLTPYLKYYVRAFAKNSAGTVFYGNEVSFTTLKPK